MQMQGTVGSRGLKITNQGTRGSGKRPHVAIMQASFVIPMFELKVIETIRAGFCFLYFYARLINIYLSPLFHKNLDFHLIKKLNLLKSLNLLNFYVIN